MSQNAMPVARKASCHVANAFLSDIQPENHQIVQKTHFWQKAPGDNGLNDFQGPVFARSAFEVLIFPLRRNFFKSRQTIRTCRTLVRKKILSK